jgi:hypothetical protein
MGFIKGLAGINEELAKRTGGDFEDRPKARWASIAAKGAPQKYVFLQEVDEGSPNYSEKNGLAIFSLQHSNPDNWKKNAACTIDEGECYGCSRGWRQKVVFYINVLVLDAEDKPYVAIWSRGIGKGSVAQTLLDMAADEDYDNSITDKTFKFSRTGTTKDDTVYTLTNMGKPHGLNVEDYEVYDLEQYVFTVAPERQEAYYLDLQKGESAPEAAKTPVSASSVDADW